MATNIDQRRLWQLAGDQEGAISHEQMLDCGLTDEGIRHRVRRGRLFRIYPGVYAVGRRELTQRGRWRAALLACGEDATLSHDSAAALWGLAKPTDRIHVSVLSQRSSRDDIKVHQRQALSTATRHRVRVTTVAQTLIDIAPTWPRDRLEQAIGEAILKRLVTLKALRSAATKAGRPGAAVRAVIDRATFRVTQSELEREFLRLVVKASLPLPDAQTWCGKHRVDFLWGDVGLAVETDGGRFHASALQQLEDRRRDQAHVRAGRMLLRLTHWQVFHERAETTALLVDVFTACECRRRSRSSKRAA